MIYGLYLPLRRLVFLLCIYLYGFRFNDSPWLSFPAWLVFSTSSGYSFSTLKNFKLLSQALTTKSMWTTGKSTLSIVEVSHVCGQPHCLLLILHNSCVTYRQCVLDVYIPLMIPWFYIQSAFLRSNVFIPLFQASLWQNRSVLVLVKFLYSSQRIEWGIVSWCSSFNINFL